MSKETKIVILHKPLAGVTLLLWGVQMNGYDVPAGTIIALCPMLGCANERYIFKDNQLMFHPDNYEFVMSHCNIAAVDGDNGEKFLSAFVKSQKAERELFNFMK